MIPAAQCSGQLIPDPFCFLSAAAGSAFRKTSPWGKSRPIAADCRPDIEPAVGLSPNHFAASFLRLGLLLRIGNFSTNLFRKARAAAASKRPLPSSSSFHFFKTKLAQMPFIGKDWRAPGDLWVRVNHVNDSAGWEQIKLRPIQLDSFPPSRVTSTIFTTTDPDPLAELLEQPPLGGEETAISNNSSSRPIVVGCFPLGRNNSGSPPLGLAMSLDGMDSEICSSSAPDDRLMLLTDESSPPPLGESSSEMETNEEEEEGNDRWTPYCFVKPNKNRTKEFIGCTSVNEAFHRLDIARAVSDIRRFNYICKVVQIMVSEKLQNLSASSRKSLFAIIQAMVLHSVDQDTHISTAKDILNTFCSGLDSPHVCGSPQLVSRQQGTCSNLLDLIARISPPHTLSEASPESTTFLDLPREVLSLILSKLPDHVSLLEAAKANETLQALVESEQRQWSSLCHFHFSQAQIDKHQVPDQTWRQLFFELKKYYGLRETYADLIHICCHCKALFWKDHGHPCVSKGEAPSVRVTPKQFVDMLLFL